MSLARFHMSGLGVLLLVGVFLSAPIITRAAGPRANDCIENARWWHKKVYNLEFNDARVVLMIERVLDRIDGIGAHIPRDLNWLEAEITRYNNSPQAHTREETQLLWVKFNEVESLIESYKRMVNDGWRWVNPYCQHADSNSLFSGAEHAAVRERLNNAVGDNGRHWTSITEYNNRLQALRRRMPSFLFFGNFEYPLPGITGTIDQFVRNPNPILRYINIVMISVIAGIVAIALISIVVAGYLYVTAGGNAQKVATAKSLIGAALLGIVLALGAFLILNTIGTQFASGLREPSLTP